MAEVRPKSQQQPPSDETPARDAALIAGIATLLAVGGPPRPTAAKVAALIGVSVAAVAPIVVLAMSPRYASNLRVIGGPKSDTATSETLEAESLYRAAYVLASSRRVARALADGKTPEQVHATEQRYFQQHLDAVQNRAKRAGEVDRAAKRYGPTLGWYAVMDNRTSPECKDANGKNFNVAQKPQIGYPGAVHPHCRCKPGKAHATQQTVYGIKPERRKAS